MYETNNPRVAFDAALARAIFEIDAPFPQLTSSRFLGRVRELILFQTQDGLHSKQTEVAALQMHQEVMVAVQGMRHRFDPKSSLEDHLSDAD